MTSTTNRSGSALALERAGVSTSANRAGVIDLVHLPRGTRPTPIAYLEFDEVNRCRHLGCHFYHECLAFAAHVQWRSFHCRQCPLSPARGTDSSAHSAPSDDAPLASVIKLR